jgi:hypothetical protein
MSRDWIAARHEITRLCRMKATIEHRGSPPTYLEAIQSAGTNANTPMKFQLPPNSATTTVAVELYRALQSRRLYQ